MSAFPLRRREILALAALAPAAALAQLDAARPVRIVVPFAPGGGADVIIRGLAVPMSQELEQPVVIDNRPGADGIIAADHVAKSQPDGHTLFFASATALCFLPAVRKTLPYDPGADFTAISQLAEFGFFLYVHPSVPARDVAELVSYSKANPGKMNHGWSTATSFITSTLLAKAHGIDMTQVPYKTDAHFQTDLLSGRLQFAFASGALLPQVRQGNLRALLTTLPERNPLHPDVPTWAEAKMPPLGFAIFNMLVGPARMQRATVERLSRALSAALVRPEPRQQAHSIAARLRSSTPDEADMFLKGQALAWRNAVRAVGLQPE